MTIPRCRGRYAAMVVRGAFVALIGLLALPAPTQGQDPSKSYLTITTPHFDVSFTPPLETLARRVASHAERAFGQLAAELHPPRGRIHILVSDDADFSNGSATTYPTNRIVVYATPPVNESSLRFTTDWAQLVVTHELAHIFHLDRTRGIWKLGQSVFGRSPFLFPNFYQPSWIIEGFAVHEESRHAGQGRIEGAEHTLIARAAAADHAFPSIGEASLALPRFPLGSSAYVYGSLFFDHLAKTRGEAAVRRFVESSSAQLVPYLVDIPARRAFGTSFTRAWDQWRDSLLKFAGDAAAGPLPGWRELTTDGLIAEFPRWMNDSTLIYTGTGGRESYAAHTLTVSGERHRQGRRNSPSPTSLLPDGSLLFAQSDYRTPYEFRSDLYVERDGRQRRITTGARLFGPHARADGAVVASQIVDGSARLVRLTMGGSPIVPLTPASLDTLWSEPRWSHDGAYIAAIRWIRGGVSQVVILDTVGRPMVIVASGRRMASSPSWLPSDTGLVYTLADGTSSDIFLTSFTPRAAEDERPAYLGRFASMRTRRMTRSVAGIFEPQISPGGLRGRNDLAALTLRGNGYRVGVGSCCGAGEMVLDGIDEAPDPRLPVIAPDTTPAHRYSAIRQMLPRYWVPLAEAGIDAGSYRLGGYTEAWDILRRHSMYAELLVPTDNSGLTGGFRYQYRGLGLPVISLSGVQDWSSYARVVSRTSPATVLGDVRRRVRDGEMLATVIRQRVRSSLSASLGAGVERREYVSTPDSLLNQVDAGGEFAPATFPRLTMSLGYSAYQTPPFAISPEDGYSIGVTARQRLRSGFNATGPSSLSLVSSVSGYKSLDLPGYAHHVLALRVAGGWADTRTNGYYEVGGISGGTFQVVPGYSIGEGRRNFPVRGFAPGSLIGIRAVSGSVEYRAPLALSHRTLGTLPLFLQRTALTLFGDYGVAWCPSTATTRQVCTDEAREVRADITSVGAELALSAGLLSWDSPYRFRVGVALPLQNRAQLGARRLSAYLTSGISF